MRRVPLRAVSACLSVCRVLSVVLLLAQTVLCAPTFTTSFVVKDPETAVTVDRVLSYLRNLTVPSLPNLPAAVTAGNITLTSAPASS